MWPGAKSPGIYDMTIEALEPTSRTYNCLRRAQITKVGQILEMTADELLGLRNFDHRSLAELRERLAAYGLSLESNTSRHVMADDFEDDEEEEQ